MEKEYVKREELDCPCCGMNNTRPSFLKKLNKARLYAGIPFVINSGCRCKKHNDAVGGAEDSDHMIGGGADIRCSSGLERFIIVNALIKAGITRIGVAKSFIHAGENPSKKGSVIWTY